MICFFCFEKIAPQHVGYHLIEGEKVPFHVGMVDCRNKYLLEERSKKKATLGEALAVVYTL